MNTTMAVLSYEVLHAARSRSLILYGAVFLVAGELLFRFSSSSTGALLSLSSLSLLVIPLAAMVMGAMFVYDSREFTELLLSQPVNRVSLYNGLWFGLTAPMVAVWMIGTLVPILLHARELGGQAISIVELLVTGALLTAIFTALSFAIAFRNEDRLRGMAATLFLWLALAFLYDAVVLLAAHIFYAYPLERPLLVLTLLNPVDLGRVVLMMNFDESALMSYTGPVFRDFFGGAGGQAVAVSTLFVWLIAPFIGGRRRFTGKDF